MRRAKNTHSKILFPTLNLLLSNKIHVDQPFLKTGRIRSETYINFVK